MTLAEARTGEKVRIERIADPEFRLLALRMGIGEGEEVALEEVIPGGPILVRRQRQRVAVGRSLARRIRVHLVR
ncbi:MAG: FeoA family protein [Bacillota bacterium]|nr:MAG: ferrous iron transport protein A [Bacillota bacterium]